MYDPMASSARGKQRRGTARPASFRFAQVETVLIAPIVCADNPCMACTALKWDRDSLDRLLFDMFRGNTPNMGAARKILRHWTLGEEIFQLLMERGWRADAREDHATWMFR